MSVPDLLSLTADKAPTVVLDLETTGLHPDQGDRVIEIGAVRVSNDEQEVFSQLIDPGRPIPARATEIHHIDDAMLSGKPSFAAAWPRLRALLDGSVLVAHNATTDLAFVDMECARAGLRPPQPAAVIDTLELARTVFGLIHCSLAALCQRLEVHHDPPHRALSDARATLDVYRAMIAAVDPSGPPTVKGLQQLPVSLAKGGTARREMRAALRNAQANNSDVVIDYTSAAGGDLTTRRQITITRVRPPYVEAHCHLRHEARVFKLTRIRRVLPVADPAVMDSES